MTKRTPCSHCNYSWPEGEVTGGVCLTCRSNVEPDERPVSMLLNGFYRTPKLMTRKANRDSLEDERVSIENGF